MKWIIFTWLLDSDAELYGWIYQWYGFITFCFLQPSWGRKVLKEGVCDISDVASKWVFRLVYKSWTLLNKYTRFRIQCIIKIPCQAVYLKQYLFGCWVWDVTIFIIDNSWLDLWMGIFLWYTFVLFCFQ